MEASLDESLKSLREKLDKLFLSPECTSLPSEPAADDSVALTEADTDADETPALSDGKRPDDDDVTFNVVSTHAESEPVGMEAPTRRCPPRMTTRRWTTVTVYSVKVCHGTRKGQRRPHYLPPQLRLVGAAGNNDNPRRRTTGRTYPGTRRERHPHKTLPLLHHLLIPQWTWDNLQGITVKFVVYL